MTVSVANTGNTNTFGYLISRLNELADAMSTKTITVETAATTGNAIVNGTILTTNIRSNSLSGGNSTNQYVLNVSSNMLFQETYLFIGNSTVNSSINSTSIQIYQANTTSLNTNTINTINNISVGNATINVVINSSSFSTNNILINTSGLLIGNSTSNVSVNSSSVSINGVPVGESPTINVRTSGTSAQLVDYNDKTTYRAAEYLITLYDNDANNKQISKVLLLHDSGSNSYLTEYGSIFSNSIVGSFSSNSNSTHFSLLITPISANCQVKAKKTTIVI